MTFSASLPILSSKSKRIAVRNLHVVERVSVPIAVDQLEIERTIPVSARKRAQVRQNSAALLHGRCEQIVAPIHRIVGINIQFVHRIAQRILNRYASLLSRDYAFAGAQQQRVQYQNAAKDCCRYFLFDVLHVVFLLKAAFINWFMVHSLPPPFCRAKRTESALQRNCNAQSNGCM